MLPINTSEVWRCEPDSNRYLLDRQSSALPLSYRSKGGRRLLPAACRMSFTRRLLDGEPGRRLHAGTPALCTNALVRDTHTLALSVASRGSRTLYIALPLFPTNRELGRPDLPGISARPPSGILTKPRIRNLVEDRGFEPRAFRMQTGCSAS